MSKYHAAKTAIDGYTFDSKAEANRYLELKLLERAGEISDITVHPSFLLQEAFKYQGKTERAIYYEADFLYHSDGLIVEDVKGVRTEVYRIKRKLFLHKYPDINFVEIKVGRR